MAADITTTPTIKPTPAVKRDRWAETRRAMRRHWVLYLLIAPVLIYFAIFLFYPMAQGIHLSTQKAGLLGPVG
ncbi:MAG TPA: hypothetical protein VGD86_10330, partial [Devosia sp.]